MAAVEIVHVLHWGKILCNFTPKEPRNWPPGHKWIGMDEASLATCPLCKEKVANKVVNIREKKDAR